ncbi:ChaN family lipoprotein [Cerasicoccus maritimus]|uniref:ChaN family lipoprotein n=1 Tax=Cerasicoccus maritimus TaxID=490089 RepID=UPI002852BB2E|nr:ChaN family lipoprotein [Cerasicoccus maritimus]
MLTLLSVAFLSGCATTTPQAAKQPTPDWVVYDAQSGTPVEWIAMSNDVLAADAILWGEQHNDAIGHQLEQRLTGDLLSTFPDSAVALEMLERHEQVWVDLYLDGQIETATFIKLTNSANWGGGKNTWGDWYQPIIDVAKEQRPQGATVIAANAPREYARAARLEDYETLQQAISAHQPTLAVVPDEAVDDQAYHDRFVGMMTGHGHGEDAPQIDAESYLRAQRVWDATMANAVVTAKQSHRKVILFIGDFHIANLGGTQQRIKHHAPELKLVTISAVAKADPTQWNPDDADRADYVIYTAKPASADGLMAMQ